MTRAGLVVDDGEHCEASWGPEAGRTTMHICERSPRHDGRHQCVCGSWKYQALEGEGDG